VHCSANVHIHRWIVCLLGVCNAGEYECATGRGCVLAIELCNGLTQCADGSDEDWHAGCAAFSDNCVYLRVTVYASCFAEINLQASVCL